MLRIVDHSDGDKMVTASASGLDFKQISKKLGKESTVRCRSASAQVLLTCSLDCYIETTEL